MLDALRAFLMVRGLGVKNVRYELPHFVAFMHQRSIHHYSGLCIEHRQSRCAFCGEAGAHAARRDPDLQRFYRRKLVQKGLGKARVVVARRLGC